MTKLEIQSNSDWYDMVTLLVSYHKFSDWKVGCPTLETIMTTTTLIHEMWERGNIAPPAKVLLGTTDGCVTLRWVRSDYDEATLDMIVNGTTIEVKKLGDNTSPSDSGTSN